MERYKADELFDSLADYGDPFPVMSALEPDEQNLPLRICVGDMSTEYCKYHYDEEAFCIKLAKCMELEMEPQTCRPEVCPFLARGCKVASACMQKSVLDEYKKEFAKTSTTTNTATVGASTGAAATAASTPGFKVCCCFCPSSVTFLHYYPHSINISCCYLFVYRHKPTLATTAINVLLHNIQQTTRIK